MKHELKPSGDIKWTGWSAYYSAPLMVIIHLIVLCTVEPMLSSQNAELTKYTGLLHLHHV